MGYHAIVTTVEIFEQLNCRSPSVFGNRSGKRVNGERCLESSNCRGQTECKILDNWPAGDEESLIIRRRAGNRLCSHIYVSPAISPACTWLALQTMSRRHLQPSWDRPVVCLSETKQLLSTSARWEPPRNLQNADIKRFRHRPSCPLFLRPVIHDFPASLLFETKKRWRLQSSDSICLNLKFLCKPPRFEFG